MNKKTEIIRPSSSRAETGLICGAVALILLASGVGVSQRQFVDYFPRLYDWQVSSFYDLESTDQAVYNALLPASDELWWIHGDLLYFGTEEEQADPWPTVEELNEYLMPPFAKDAAWSQQGEVNWQRVASFSFEGSTVYFGSGGKIPGQSAYLVMLSHVHKGASYTNGATIWLHSDPDVPTPETVTRDSLIVNGWKEVVPYNGAMEVDRLQGE